MVTMMICKKTLTRLILLGMHVCVCVCVCVCVLCVVCVRARVCVWYTAK